MNVLFLDQTGSIGGAELSLFDIATHFGAQAKVVLLEDGAFARRLEMAGVDVEVLSRHSALMFARGSGKLAAARTVPTVAGLALRLARRLRHVDVVHATGQKALIVGALAAKLAGKPLIWHLRDLLVPEHFSATSRAVAVRFANWGTASVIANSRATAAAFTAAGGRNEGLITIHNGVRAAPFDAVTEGEAAAARGALGVQRGVPLVGLFGRLAPWKGQHVLLEALSELPEVHAVLVGDAQFGEVEYAAALRRRVDNLGLGSRVQFLGYREDVPALMKACDVIVHASVAPEPFGRVIVEGMLAGRPVVATRGGGVTEVIDDGVTGVLVAPSDVGDLTKRLAELLGSPSLRNRLASAGRSKALTRFSIDRMLSSVESHLSTVVQKNGEAVAGQYRIR